MTSRGFRRLWIAGILLVALGIAAASLLSMPDLATAGGTDKFGHFAAYFTLMLLGAGIVDSGRLWRVALRCLLLGIALEAAQAWWTADRHADWADLVANVAGIGAAWLAAGGARAGWARHLEARLARRR